MFNIYNISQKKKKKKKNSNILVWHNLLFQCILFLRYIYKYFCLQYQRYVFQPACRNIQGEGTKYILNYICKSLFLYYYCCCCFFKIMYTLTRIQDVRNI